jgi:hypothetical protein
MLARTLVGGVRTRLAPSLASLLLRRGYASPASSAAAAADDLVIDEDPPRAASTSAAAAATTTVAATVPTVLQPRVLIYDGVCHLCHRGEWDSDTLLWLGFSGGDHFAGWLPDWAND